ncbi:RCC1 domain-containing protein [Cohnella phaseoli]|uniref:S-layer family protein n=1 Tax=Cohnella phaseoli TaxID=456490 RepID=A0A3D9JME3_9BACL|nr:S-layer homology domain-containing protein [Cohnella phaseoli]RED75261.1 S-layer family protein [Cohnella phaseoli]
MIRKVLIYCMVVVIVFNLIPSHEAAAAAEGRFDQTIASGNGRVYAIKQDGSLWYWGKGTFNDQSGDQSPERAKITKLMDDVIGVYADWFSGYVIKADRSMWTVGDHGEVVKVMDDVKAVANSYTEWIALKTDGTVWKGDIHRSITPKKKLSDVVQISAGINAFYAVKEDGTLWGWGNNYSGTLGIKTPSPDVLTPILIMKDVASVHGAGMAAFAVKKDGSLWGWGNHDGLIFNGADETWAFDPYDDGSQSIVASQFTPVKLMDKVLKIDGRNHLAVIKKDKSLWLWGENEDGQLGDGTQLSRFTPQKVLDDVVDVTAEGAFTIALRSDGTLWGFGTNSVGELGLGAFDYDPHTMPIRLMDNVARTGAQASFPSLWAKEDILYASQEGLLPKRLQSQYQSSITRSEFVSLIVPLIENKTGKDLDTILLERGLTLNYSFSDTSDSDILHIAAIGIIEGIGGGRFNPEGLINREQAASILMKTALFLGSDNRVVQLDESLLADREQISSWALEAVNYCLNAEIMRGVGNSVFSPKASYSREMSIITTMRLYKLLNVGSEKGRFDEPL